MLIAGTDANDTIYGFSRSETIDGLAGDDTIYADCGTDTLNGGAGNDTLSGGSGDDTLDGGAGSDTLYGGSANSNWWYVDDGNGNDTYRFSRGSGQDTIYDHDRAAGNLDTIRVADDLTPDDVSIQRQGEDLVLSINDTTDRITVKNWFWNDSPEYRVEQIQFGDGTEWGRGGWSQAA